MLYLISNNNKTYHNANILKIKKQNYHTNYQVLNNSDSNNDSDSDSNRNKELKIDIKDIYLWYDFATINHEKPFFSMSSKDKGYFFQRHLFEKFKRSYLLDGRDKDNLLPHLFDDILILVGYKDNIYKRFYMYILFWKEHVFFDNNNNKCVFYTTYYITTDVLFKLPNNKYNLKIYTSTIYPSFYPDVFSYNESELESFIQNDWDVNIVDYTEKIHKGINFLYRVHLINI